MMEFTFNCRYYNRKAVCLLVFIILCVYFLLTWFQFVPSVFHINHIRRIWDKDFANCLLHIEKEENLVHSQQKQTFVTAKLSGRLGNWLFAYASLLGIARQNGIQYFTRPDADPRVHLEQTFKVTQVKSMTPKCSQHIYENLPCAYDKKLELLPFGNVTLHGYLQSWKYFKHVEKELRQEFTFQDNVMSEAKKKFQHHINAVKSKNFTQTTCIHVRRTDMMIKSSTKRGFKAAPLTYIINAMEYFREKFKLKIIFVVISDDFVWCSKNLRFSDTVIIRRNSLEVDLALLTLCDNSIITTGTFGWWGAWLANGHTVYYSNYPEPGSILDRDTVREDYFPPDWVPIDNAMNQYYSVISISILLFINVFIL